MQRQYTRINKAWHENNRMPKNPSPRERLKWHLAHAKNCECRQLNEKMVEKLKKEAKKSDSNTLSPY